MGGLGKVSALRRFARPGGAIGYCSGRGGRSRQPQPSPRFPASRRWARRRCAVSNLPTSRRPHRCGRAASWNERRRCPGADRTRSRRSAPPARGQPVPAEEAARPHGIPVAPGAAGSRNGAAGCRRTPLRRTGAPGLVGPGGRESPPRQDRGVDAGERSFRRCAHPRARGWLYLAVALDPCSRQIVGGAIQGRMQPTWFAGLVVGCVAAQAGTGTGAAARIRAASPSEPNGNCSRRRKASSAA